MSDQLNSLSNMHQVNQVTTPLASKIHYGPPIACYLLVTEKMAIYYRLGEVLEEGPTTKINIPALHN